MRALWSSWLLLVIVAPLTVFGQQEEEKQCPPILAIGGVLTRDYLVPTPDYALRIESASGASGEVVGVSVFLESHLPNAQLTDPAGAVLAFAVCHDPRVAEIVGQPVLTDELQSLLGVLGVGFRPIDEETGMLGDRGHGFWGVVSFHPERYKEKFPSSTPLEMMTVYYRLKGATGESSALSFCDQTLQVLNESCIYNFLHLWNRENNQGVQFLSDRNEDGLLSVEDGEVGRAEPPVLVPEAKVYPGPLTAEQVGFATRITNAVAARGGTNVRVDVFASAELEYTGLIVPIDFDERFLRVDRAESQLPGGNALVDNESRIPGADNNEGHVVFLSPLLGVRRLAAAGDELLVGTVDFDVLPAASESVATELRIAPVFLPSGALAKPIVVVRERRGARFLEGDETVEVTPILLGTSLVALRGQPTVQLGDVTADASVDVGDVVASLRFLFLRQGVACPDAFDFNGDRRSNIEDPIDILNALFRGIGPKERGQILCGQTEPQ